jgi:hypothetical protein
MLVHRSLGHCQVEKATHVSKHAKNQKQRRITGRKVPDVSTTKPISLASELIPDNLYIPVFLASRSILVGAVFVEE